MARNVLGSQPASTPLLGLRPGFRDRVVSRSTDLCLEGFPRSGNSFVLKAFTVWNPEATVAHHLHVAGQVARAARWDIPCAVLVRRPEDTVASLLVAVPGLDPGVALWSYTTFHHRIASHRDAVVLAEFERAVVRPWEVVAGVNERFGTSFAWHVLDEAARTAIEAAVREWNVRDRQPPGLVAVPSPAKERAKAAFVPRIRRHPRLAAAVDSYERLLAT